jgi:hypothetical protein
MMQVAWVTPICRFMSARRINELHNGLHGVMGFERPRDLAKGSMPAY